MSDLQNMADLVSTGNQLLDDIRGGAISRMAHEHQTQQAEFKSEHDAKQAEFAQAHNVQMQQHDTAVASRRAAVDAVLDDLAGHTVMNIHYYDRALHTKQSLNIVPDAEDETRSEWIPVPYSTLDPFCYDKVGAVTMVHAQRCLAYPGGYPAYEADTSITKMQFIVANEEATSSQINEHIESNSINLGLYGTWDVTARTMAVPTIGIYNLHPYKVLFVRFVNRPHNGAAQNIVNFGGNASFSIDRVVNYPKIPK